MHLLVPFAAPLSDAGRQVLPGLALPALQRVLAQSREVARDEGDAFSRNPPHERALARARGLEGLEDGLIPLAALAARAGQLTADDAGRGWAWFTPTHWYLDAEHVSVLDPALLALDEAESRAWFDSMRELFESEGFDLHWLSPTAWLARHTDLAALPAASLDRVVGRNVDYWLDPDPRARLLRRIQNEVQMLWYTHPLNAQREARRQLTLTGVWVSGCGRDPGPGHELPAEVQVDNRLREPALAEDWAAWQAAWQALDAGPVQALADALLQGRSVGLTLCGERHAVTWNAARAGGLGGLVQRAQSRWRRPDVRAVMENL